MSAPVFAFHRIVPEAKLPFRADPTATGWDVSSAEARMLEPGDTALIRTGLVVECPAGWGLQVRSRSGLAAKHSVHTLNSPGTIDNGYRGEICVILHNSGRKPFPVAVGDRVAQLIPEVVHDMQVVESDGHPGTDTARGAGGFGSTGRS